MYDVTIVVTKYLYFDVLWIFQILFDKDIIKTLANKEDLGPEPDTVALLMRKGAKVCEVQAYMNERTAGESYLTFSRSITYMARMMVSILILQWFRKG